MSDYGVLKDGSSVKKVVLANQQGMVVSLISFGAAITHLWVKNKHGELIDVVLGYDELDDYVNGNDAFGAVVGRHANRIKDAQFTIDGETYLVTANNGKHSLHSGPSNFVKHNFDTILLGDNTVRFISTSFDQEEGFPGNVTLTVEVTLTDDNQLILDYHATTDHATPINITNHAFFNLNGHQSGDAMNHRLMIDSDWMTLNDGDSVPTGESVKLDGTPFDFRKLTPIKAHINDNHDQIRYGSGYDHNFVLNQAKAFHAGSKLTFAAQLVGDVTGLIMNTYTTQPGLQLYTANHLKNDTPGKNKCRYGWRHGVCLETQHFPASPSYSHFPNVILRPGEVYQETTIYEFK
jgi:aldose 1-epimerase